MGRRVLNIHERSLPITAQEAAPLLDRLASRQDVLWPHGVWPRMRFDTPQLEVGAVGGHGPVRYTVNHYSPGESVVFRFTGPPGFHGTHGVTITPDPETPHAGCLVRHTLVLRPTGRARLGWPLFFRPLHDALVEDAMDNAARWAEAVAAGDAAHEHLAVRALDTYGDRWSPYVRLLRRVAITRGRRATPAKAADMAA